MSTLTDALQTKDTTTENGMETNSSTLNDCVNLFFTIGAMRGQEMERLISLFSKAFEEDKQTALRILFWVRDVRGGAGERQITKDILQYLAITNPTVLENVIQFIPTYGRWDDLHCLFNTTLELKAIKLIVEGLESGNGLAAKWTPRKGEVFNKVRGYMKVSPKTLRKMVVGLSNTVEQHMCSKQWGSIEYDKIPSLAMARYSKAFYKNDEDRFFDYKQSLKAGDVKINAGALYPYDVLKTLTRGDSDIAIAQWDELPNYMEGVEGETILPVVDVSGSMTCPAGNNQNLSCMDVAISLGLYISERNTGSLKDTFMTFSEKPQIQKLKGNLLSKHTQLKDSDWGYSTNLEKVFETILQQAVKHDLPQSELPTKVLILSDMEFNQAVRRNETAYETIKRNFTENGYDVPKVVFWNIQSRQDNFPVRFDEEGVCLVSGFSPSIMTSLLGGDEMTPVSIMNKTVNSERYEQIKI
jgi:hypothetical protein